MSLARLFNNLPTYIAFDDVETLTDAGAISVTKLVTLIDMTVERDVQFTLAALTSVGQIKIIVRKDDVYHTIVILLYLTGQTSVAAPQILLETCSNLYRTAQRVLISLHSNQCCRTSSTVA